VEISRLLSEKMVTILYTNRWKLWMPMDFCGIKNLDAREFLWEIRTPRVSVLKL
jgi:hypothetical protein